MNVIDNRLDELGSSSTAGSACIYMVVVLGPGRAWIALPSLHDVHDNSTASVHSHWRPLGWQKQLAARPTMREAPSAIKDGIDGLSSA